jgi:hypothetical protein
MTDSELDSFSTELLGFSITAGKQAAQSYIEGNTNSLNSLINSAAKVNGVTPEHATKLMNNVLAVQ